MPCFHWSFFGPFSWTILGPCWCLSLISWLSRYHRYLNHRVLDILQDQANSKRSVGLLSLTRTDATRWLPNMQIHGDLHWDQQEDCMSSNRRHHIESDLSKIRVQPWSVSSRVKPWSQVNLIRSGMVRRIVAWLQRWCVRYASGNSWIRQKLSGIALLGRNKVRLDSRASFPVLIPDEEWRLEKASQLRKWKSQRNLSLPFFTNCPPHIVQEVTRHLFCKGRCVAAICKFGGTDIYRKIEISKVQKGNVAFRCIWDLGETWRNYLSLLNRFLVLTSIDHK